MKTTDKVVAQQIKAALRKQGRGSKNGEQAKAGVSLANVRIKLFDFVGGDLTCIVSNFIFYRAEGKL